MADVTTRDDALGLASEHIRVQAEAQLRYAETMRERLADARDERDALRARLVKVAVLQPKWRSLLMELSNTSFLQGRGHLATEADELRHALDAAVESAQW